MTDFRTEGKCINARNTHNPRIFPEDTVMSEDHQSYIFSFKEMKFGSVQMVWQGADAQDAQVQLYVSNRREPDTFVPYDASVDCTGNRSGKMWNLGVIGFLYGYLDYKANSVTTGTMNAWATGKK